MKNIPVAQPIIGKSEIRAVVKVLKSGSLAQGKVVTEFEDSFAKSIHAPFCVAVNSGTSALHLALLALGIGQGDEVIVPSFTFAATANSVVLAGATPIFVDIDPETFTLDANLVEQRITEKTKAIQVVHLYGLPANMPRLMEIARKYKLKVVEDAAQAHLATIQGKFAGTFGDAAAFSFYPTKNMTSGEGGMIAFHDAEAARVSKLLRNQGMEIRYQNEVVGFNLRMTEIHASIGVAQLKKLPNWTAKRQENARFLNSRITGVELPYTPTDYGHVFHQYTIRVKNLRDEFSKTLTELGVGNSVYYPTPVHKLPSFQDPIDLPETTLASEQVLSIPIHPSLSKKDLIRIADAVSSTAEKISQ